MYNTFLTNNFDDFGSQFTINNVIDRARDLAQPEDIEYLRKMICLGSRTDVPKEKFDLLLERLRKVMLTMNV